MKSKKMVRDYRGVRGWSTVLRRGDSKGDDRCQGGTQQARRGRKHRSRRQCLIKGLDEDTGMSCEHRMPGPSVAEHTSLENEKKKAR